MATKDKTVGGTGVLAANDSGEGFTLKGEIDFAVDNQSSGDIIQLISIPADTHVLAVDTKVVTAEGGTLTYESGDAVDPNGWDAAVDGNVAGSVQGNGAFASDGGKLYTSADTLDIVINNDADKAKIQMFAFCHRLA